jgi:cellulose synthase/poly-beta-1,6-N-acetylglucosamine synthase-like glycosyltransferase
MFFAWTVAALISIPLLLLIAEFLAALLMRSGPARALDAPPPFAILMPAHNEVLGIAAAVAAARAQLRPCDRLIVLADNCTDGTAAAARRAGAFVVTRTNPHARGKGFALAFGRDVLLDHPPSVVIVLDADCVPAPEALGRLAAVAAHEQAAVQGRFLLTPPAMSSPVVGISTFAFRIKNHVRQRGLFRMGGVALLQGTGMAFPWDIFKTAPLATPSLVEDLQLGLDLFLAGQRICFDEGALITSRASSQPATVTQRTRWEHGQLATAARYLPRLVHAGVHGRAGALLLALDLAVPPLSLLTFGIGCGFMAQLIIAWFTGNIAPLLTLTAICALFLVSLLSVWFHWGRDLLPLGSLARLPQYVLWKLPIYGRLLVRRQRVWLRTSREP